MHNCCVWFAVVALINLSSLIFVHFLVEIPQVAQTSRSRSTSVPDPLDPEPLNPELVPGQDSTLRDLDGGLFSGKRFLLVGFGSEAEAHLSLLVTENAGRVLAGHTRAVADYAIVPLLGCEVEATVGDVATDTWLVRCAEIMSAWGN